MTAAVCLILCSNQKPAQTCSCSDMDRCGPKVGKALLTPKPHFIPGYAGYCPQLKFNIGKSYGKLMAELLSRPEVVSSEQTDTNLTLRGLADSNLKRMIPGYTGFIPKSQNYFACPYSETCHKALTEFCLERQARLQQPSEELPAAVSSRIQQTDRTKPPLIPITNKSISYEPVQTFAPPGRPFSMDDDNPHKHFISGFTGHVPKSRFLIGKGYPIITKQALIQSGKQQSYLTAKDLPDRKNRATTPLPCIYTSDRGVVPSFAGHIPGYKFTYGQTFGQLSKNALEKSGIKRKLLEKPLKKTTGQ
ncbi:protein FAM166B [Acanthochromis polyacanthus]|uniref:protein FAM166B n=1 Tax=Acanthochromis polyacanthus TaxID=80966 RepID=UPI002233E995|nr:protein FAM166B [Acanthochromis polyacanthus]